MSLARSGLIGELESHLKRQMMVAEVDWSIARGLLVADQEIAAFRSAVLGNSFTSVARLTSSTQQIFRAEVGGVLSVLRVVSQTSPRAAERRANAFHRVARALSPHRMSSPVVLTRFKRSHSGVPTDTDIVVTEHAPPTYQEVGNILAADVLPGVKGKDRYLGAMLSYITHLADHGKLRNLLFSTNPSGEFPFWFIDIDFAFGATMRWGFGKPVFYPGHQLNYQTKSYAARAPALAVEFLEWIESLPAGQIARVFGLSRTEASDMRVRCITVKRLGLAAAIERERFWGPEDGLLTRWKGMAYGMVTKSAMACRSLYSWRP
jgi:hypothetical protein